MNGKKTYMWEGTGTKLPDGHTIIETHDHPDGSRWAIMDESGRRPEQTTDGVMWIDQSRCLDASTRHAPLIPMLDQNGEQHATVTDTPTLLFLARMFRWTIVDEVRGHYYNVS